MNLFLLLCIGIDLYRSARNYTMHCSQKGFHFYHFSTFHSRLKTDSFYSCTTTRPPPQPVTTVAPRCLLGLTFSSFDLAPNRNEKFGYCGLDLVWRRCITWSP